MISNREEWQRWVQDRNADLCAKARWMYESPVWTTGSLAIDLGIPEWLVKCLIGMPVDQWWWGRGMHPAPPNVRLP